MTWERGSCTNREHNLLRIRITTFKQVIAYTRPRPSVSSILFTYQLSTTDTYYRLSIHFCIINYRPLVRFHAVSVQGVKISPCILYHFVVLAPGNPQEQSQMNTNMCHEKIACQTVSDSSGELRNGTRHFCTRYTGVYKNQ